MKKTLNDIKALIPWGIATYVLLMLTYLLVDREAQFYIGSTFLILLYMIYTFSKQIGGLKMEIESKNELLRAVEGFELTKAIKKVEDKNSE